MATVRDILDIKGCQILTVGPDATVLDAALRMNEHKVGSLLVMDGGQLIGMFTERDILQRVVVPCLDPAGTLVSEVMTTEVICCQPHTQLAEARGVLKNRRIRHMPVLDEEGQVCGMISIGDLNAYETQDHEATIYILEEYIHGRV
jgi:CBS domain-containing protein